MWNLNTNSADFGTGRPEKRVNIDNKMINQEDKNDKNQLNFEFIKNPPDLTDQKPSQPGGSIGYVEAEQFVFPLFPETMEYPTVEFFEKYPYKKE